MGLVGALLAVGLAPAVARAGADGWRHQGTAVYADATPSPAIGTPRWRTPLPSAGNSSPLVVGDRVCLTAEPTTVLCADAATGRVLWSAHNDRLDAVPESERAAVRARLATEPTVRAALDAARRRLGDLRKLARSEAPPADLGTQIEAVAVEMDALKVKLDELASWGTAAELAPLGWASPSLATDGQSLFALFGNGVVSSFTLDGARRWTVWLGAPLTPMLGYDVGTAASPLVAGDVLVVGFRALQGLDLRTGRVRWTSSGDWRHYGTPAVGRVGDVWVVATPDGRLVRASDGRELAQGLGTLFYVGPVIAGDTLYVIGGHGEDGQPDNAWGRAWRLAPDASGGVTVTARWSRALPTTARIYTPPVVHQGLVYVASIDDALHVLDAATGAPVGRTPLTGRSRQPLFSSPTVAGTTLFVGWQDGVWAALSLGRAPAVLASGQWAEPSRATPTFVGRTTYVRTAAALYRVDP